MFVLFNLFAGLCHVSGNGSMPGSFVDLKDLVVQMVLANNVERCNKAHLFSAVLSRDFYGLLYG